ncbi:MAG: TM1802 family CRISPR-associated protein [Bacillota bacterium]
MQSFKPDEKKAAGTPFIVPIGGNPLTPQGRYGPPVYPVYDQQIRFFASGNLDEAVNFFRGRVERTLGFSLNSEECRQVAEELVGAAQKLGPGKEKVLGIVVLADTSSNDVFGLVPEDAPVSKGYAELGPSVLLPGYKIVSCLEKAMELFINARVEEGAALGSREGPKAKCSFCGEAGRTVSPDCKALPWLATTWTGPLPTSLKEERIVDSISLCPSCYSAMNFGANVFLKLTRLVDNTLVRELFAPVATATGKEAVRQSGSKETIYGSLYALPVTDGFLEDGEEREQFVEDLYSILKELPKQERNLHAITGFESCLPAGDDQKMDNYRLTLIYYSGDPGRKDIHLRTVIEDVVPSTAKQLRNLVLDVREEANKTWIEVWGPNYRQDYIYNSLPNLLVYAYGGTYLWHSLAACLHRQLLSFERFMANYVHRLDGLTAELPESHWQMKKEVFFFLIFNKFLELYTERIQNEPGGEDVVRKDWRELLDVISTDKIYDMTFDVFSLGFVAGYLTRQFHNSYYYKKKRERGGVDTAEVGAKDAEAAEPKGRDKIDFIKERIMTFGSKLSPDAVFRRGLFMMDEYARRLDMDIIANQSFWSRLGIVITAYEDEELKREVQKNRDTFMGSFWAGYHLMQLAKGEKNATQQG